MVWLVRFVAPALFAAAAGILSIHYIPSSSRLWTLVVIVVGVAASFGQAVWSQRRRPIGQPGPTNEDAPPAATPNAMQRPAYFKPYIAPFELPPIPLLVGRAAEIESILTKLARSGSTAPRGLALVGKPGVGKSALAIGAAHAAFQQFPSGILYAELTGCDYSDDAAATLLGSFVASLLGEGEKVPEGLPARRAKYRELTGPNSRSPQVLVVLDGVESSELARELIPSGQRCATLITATTPPQLNGVEVVPVLPLGPEAARELFDELVGRPASSSDEEETATETIVARTAGYPLAIQLSAAALASRRNWALSRIVRTMRALPADPTEDPRPRTLDLSFALLADDEQQALRLLGLAEVSVFSPWMLVALWVSERWASIEEREAKRLCDRLANVRLLEQVADDVTGVLAYRILEHVRDYARGLWPASGLTAALAAASQRVEAAREARQARSPLDVLQQHVYRDLEQGDVTRALNRARDALSMARELIHSGQTDMPGPTGGASREGERLALAALAEVLVELGGVKDADEMSRLAMYGGYPSAMARALRCQGRLLWRQRRLEASVDSLEMARRYAKAQADGAEDIRIRRELAVAYAYRGHLNRAIGLLDNVPEVIASPGELRRLRASVQWARSMVEVEAFDAGDDEALDRADVAATAALAAADDDDQRLWRAWAVLQQARVARRRGRHTRARTLALAALDDFVAMRHRYGAGTCRWETGRTFLDQQRYTDALPMLEEAREIFATCGDRWMEASVAVDLARARRLQGYLTEADRELADAAQLYQSLGPVPADPEPKRAYDALRLELRRNLDAGRRRAPSRDLRDAEAVSSAW